MRATLATCALVLLSGCSGEGLTLPGFGGTETRGVRAMSMFDGAVSIRGPEGYCIDMQASEARRGFAVLAGCALTSRQAQLMPRLDGLVTVQVGAPGSAVVTGAETELAALLASEAGQALLDPDSTGASAPQIDAIAGAVVVVFEPAGRPAFDGTSGPVWRGFLDLGDRAATVTVRSFDRAPLEKDEGERLLLAMIDELSRANAEVGPEDDEG